MALTKHKSVSVSKSGGEHGGSDQRVIRTRRQLDAAFVELLHRRSYADIRVSDITKKAGVGRATYYAHYSSKGDLLRSQFTRVVAPMLVTKPDDPALIDCTPLFNHIKTAPRLYKALTGGPDGSGSRILRECFEERVAQLIDVPRGDSGHSFGMPSAMITRFVASSILGIVERWVESGAEESPQEMQTVFQKLVGGGLAAAVDGEDRRASQF